MSKVTTDPSKQIEKSHNLLGAELKLSFFEAYNSNTGMILTWNEFQLNGLDDSEIEAIVARMELIKHIECPWINHLYSFWINKKEKMLYFITESVGQRTIYDFSHITDTCVHINAISRWFTVVLKALDTLHNFTPPIIHGRIEIGSIFVKSSTGKVNIVMPFPFNKETNSFQLRYYTPPENLQGIYCTNSDIWMFGIAILYCLTQTEPYSECKTPLQLVSKLANNEPPESLSTVTDPVVSQLLKQCLQPYDKRPTTSQLLQHPFFQAPLCKEPSIPKDLNCIVLFEASNQGQPESRSTT